MNEAINVSRTTPSLVRSYLPKGECSLLNKPKAVLQRHGFFTTFCSVITTDMKNSRLLTYAIMGIIGGLLFENKFLRVKQDVKDKCHALKDKKRDIEDETKKLKSKLAGMMHKN